MTTKKPEYHLQRVYDDGTRGQLEICPLTALPGDVNMSRRGLLVTGVTVAAALGVMDGTLEAPLAAESENGSPGRANVVFAHTKAVQSLAFSPDGSLLASGSRDGTAKLWKIADGRVLKVFKEHDDWVNAVAIGVDGDRLITASRNGKIHIWSLPDCRNVKTLDDHKYSVECLAIAPDGVCSSAGMPRARFGCGRCRTVGD